VAERAKRYGLTASHTIVAALKEWFRGDQPEATRLLGEIANSEGFAVLFGMYIQHIETCAELVDEMTVDAAASRTRLAGARRRRAPCHRRRGGGS
jgi:hypothetical protein